MTAETLAKLLKITNQPASISEHVQKIDLQLAVACCKIQHSIVLIHSSSIVYYLKNTDNSIESASIFFI
jgi:hypothetical protein